MVRNIFFTRFTEFNDGVQIGSRPNPDYYRDAFYSPVGVGDELWVLYNGKFVTNWIQFACQGYFGVQLGRGSIAALYLERWRFSYCGES